MISRSTAWGAALLIVGLVTGAGVTHAVQVLGTSRFLNTGLFTLAHGETALYNVTLDDVRTGPPATVLMEIIDKTGAIVARQSVVLAAGQSATLKFDQSGMYRAHAQFVTQSGTLTERRALITSLEIIGDPLGGLTIPRVYVCSSSSDGADNGRLPD